MHDVRLAEENNSATMDESCLPLSFVAYVDVSPLLLAKPSRGFVRNSNPRETVCIVVVVVTRLCVLTTLRGRYAMPWGEHGLVFGGCRNNVEEHGVLDDSSVSELMRTRIRWRLMRTFGLKPHQCVALRCVALRS